MGASNLEHVLDGTLTPADIKKWFDETSRTAAYESGHSYSGDWNMMTGVKVETAHVFPNENAASEYVLDHTEKWKHALAVKFESADDGVVKWLVGGWAAS